jgi:hypothetical protein
VTGECWYKDNKILLYFYQTIRRHIPEYSHHCENHKYDKLMLSREATVPNVEWRERISDLLFKSIRRITFEDGPCPVNVILENRIPVGLRGSQLWRFWFQSYVAKKRFVIIKHGLHDLRHFTMVTQPQRCFGHTTRGLLC